MLPSTNAGRYIIALIVKEKLNIRIDSEILDECFASLLSLTSYPYTLLVCKTEKVDSITWNHILSCFQKAFTEFPVVISICKNNIIIPPVEDRLRIIQENHEFRVTQECNKDLPSYQTKILEQSENSNSRIY